MKKIITILILLACPLLGLAETTPNWQMPFSLTKSNTKIRFEVDTTWHMVEGKVTALTGEVKLADPTNPFSISSEISIPVKKITTGWGMRDSSLQDSMEEEKFPEILLRTSSFTPKTDCSLESISAKKCNGILKGTLKIRDVEREIDLGVSITKEKDQFLVKGDITFAWALFKVIDPSIMMAKVKPDVTIFYEVLIPVSN